MNNCSDDAPPTGVKRNLNPLEEKLIGTWGWADGLDNDTTTYRSNLTFEGIKKGSSYSGTFELALDSTLTLTINTNFFGSPSHRYEVYRMREINGMILRIQQSNSAIIRYNRIDR
jgi:hypothetical protein